MHASPWCPLVPTLLPGTVGDAAHCSELLLPKPLMEHVGLVEDGKTHYSPVLQRGGQLQLPSSKASLSTGSGKASRQGGLMERTDTSAV